jgi:hypothetical protein
MSGGLVVADSVLSETLLDQGSVIPGTLLHLLDIWIRGRWVDLMVEHLANHLSKRLSGS